MTEPLNMDKASALIDVDGTQRATKNSLGRLIHPTPEGIQNFWRWFGDSKVVDEHGRPLVVFHGTKRDFDTFNPDSYQASEDSADLRPSGLDPTTYLGSHFAETSEVADSFAQGLYLGKYDEGAGHVYPCYLRVINPLKYDNEDALLEEIMSQSSDDQSVELEVAKYADENDMDEDAVWAKYDKSKSLRAYINNAALESDNDMEEPSDSLTRGLAEEYRSNVESQGVDGIRYKNMREFGYAWAVFSPDQIKSALGNNGKFSPSDHRITAAVASQPRVFYRADDGKGKRIRTGESKWDSYMFASSSIDGARLYGSTLLRLEAKPDAKILYEGTAQFKKIARKYNGKHLRLLDTLAAVVDEATASGYDAVWFEMQADIGTAIINQDAFTVSPLADQAIAMAAPSREHRRRIWYHGTSLAPHQLREMQLSGTLLPGSVVTTYPESVSDWSPQDGKVYLTASIGTAITYALIRHKYTLTSLKHPKKRNPPYLVLVAGTSLTDIGPDEDIVVKVLWQLVKNDPSASKFRWLLPLAKKSNPEDYAKYTYSGESASGQRVGKAAISNMSDAQKRQLVEYGTQNATQSGSVRILEVWELDPIKENEYLRSPNDFRELSTRVYPEADQRPQQAVAGVLRSSDIPFLVVTAKYSPENSMLRSALSDPEDDGIYVIHEFGPAELYFEYLRDNNEEEYQRLVDSTGTTDPDNNELFDAIIGGEYTPNEGVVEDFLSDTPKHRIEDAIKRYDEGHSQINFSLNNGGKLLPRQTWVGHFCSDAASIAQQGFIFGESDPRSLGLTMHKSDDARHRTSGYNFGFQLSDLRKNYEGGTYRNNIKYGEELVLFQTSGVSAYHYGDNENQVIFWGPHVEWVIPIVRASVLNDNTHSDDDYAVLATDGTYAFRTYSAVPRSKSYGFSKQKNLEICVAWAIKNVVAYRKSIVWDLPKKKLAQ